MEPLKKKEKLLKNFPIIQILYSSEREPISDEVFFFLYNHQTLLGLERLPTELQTTSNDIAEMPPESFDFGFIFPNSYSNLSREEIEIAINFIGLVLSFRK